LEEGAHLSISWSAIFENGEVKRKGEHVYHQRNDNQAKNPGTEMSS
jgi:hypothetical protein